MQPHSIPLSIAIFLFALFSYNAKAQNNALPAIGPKDSLTSSQSKMILEAIQGYSLVGLGEAEHLKREYYGINTQIAKSLIREKGFTVLAFEGSISTFERIDAYVKGDSTIDVERFLYGANVTNDSILHNLYYTKEILDLINWIRRYNSLHDKKVSVVGFDFQNPTLLVNDINKQLTITAKKADVPDDSLAYFTANLNKAALIYEKFYHDYMAYPKVMEIFKQDSLIQMAKNSSEIIRETRNYVERKYPVSKDALIGRLKVNLNALKALSVIFLDPNGAMERDKNMYENISYYRNLYDREKMILWAHNAHLSEREVVIGDGTRFFWMGHYLRQQYKREFSTVGLYQNLECISPSTSSVKDSSLQVIVKKPNQKFLKCFESNNNTVIVNVNKQKLEKAEVLN